MQSGQASGGNPLTAVAAIIWTRGLIGIGQIVALVDLGFDRNQAFFNRYNRTRLNNEITDATMIALPTPGPTLSCPKVAWLDIRHLRRRRRFAIVYGTWQPVVFEQQSV